MEKLRRQIEAMENLLYAAVQFDLHLNRHKENFASKGIKLGSTPYMAFKAALEEAKQAVRSED